MNSAVGFLFLMSVHTTASALQPLNCSDYYAGSTSPPAQWCAQGSYFTFSSPRNGGRNVSLYQRCAGNASGSIIFLGHGWPTSSYDYYDLSALLEETHFVCTIDYVGHGFSDKPPAPFVYSMFDHAQAIHDFLVLKNITEFSYLTHDEGDSVGLIFLQAYLQRAQPYKIIHHFILDGSIYLPLANLSKIQLALLNNITGPALQKTLSAEVLATGLGHDCYTPALSRTQISDLRTVFDYQNGTHILHETIQYLNERKEHENEWLAALGKSPVPCTMIWGTLDPIATKAIADYVWANYLSNRTSAPATYSVLQGANHYEQVDHAAAVAQLVLAAL